MDKDADLSDVDDQFAEKLKLNNIHIVVLEDELKYVDALNSIKYILNYSEQPCGVDWSGTVGYYSLKKIDNEAKSDKKKLSDKLLCEILLNRTEKEYTYDSVLNQINIKIPIDKNSLYFLTVRVNASNGIVDKFSCEIKDGDDFHIFRYRIIFWRSLFCSQGYTCLYSSLLLIIPCNEVVYLFTAKSIFFSNFFKVIPFDFISNISFSYLLMCL